MRDGIADITAGLRMQDLIGHLVARQVQRRFSRTALGPAWVLVTFAGYLGLMTLVSSAVLNLEPSSIVPHIAVGIALWLFLTATFTECSLVFVNNKQHLINTPLPYSAFIFSSLLANMVMLGIYVGATFILLRVFAVPFNGNIAWLLLTLPIFFGFVLGTSLVLAVVSSFVRDMAHLVATIMQLGIFVTPVWWREQDLHRFDQALVFNPFVHMINIVRDPLLGYPPQQTALVAAAVISVVVLVVGVVSFSMSRGRIAYRL